jgi:REP element-mobilizing transposase RayT
MTTQSATVYVVDHDELVCKATARLLKSVNDQQLLDLDSGPGRCLLRRPERAEIVANSLLHFDGERYRMGDFVVMPNHVHLLAAFPSAEEMRVQFDSWLHYTAYQIHQQIGERGNFWHQEPFDHLVRSVDQYVYLRDYIADNPRKAKLKPTFRTSQVRSFMFSKTANNWFRKLLNLNAEAQRTYKLCMKMRSLKRSLGLQSKFIAF